MRFSFSKDGGSKAFDCLISSWRAHLDSYLASFFLTSYYYIWWRVYMFFFLLFFSHFFGSSGWFLIIVVSAIKRKVLILLYFIFFKIMVVIGLSFFWLKMVWALGDWSWSIWVVPIEGVVVGFTYPKQLETTLCK